MGDGMLLKQNDDGTWGRYEPYTTIVVETEEEFNELNDRLELASRMQWIPCSERLPEPHTNCIVTFEMKYSFEIEWEKQIDFAEFDPDCGYLNGSWNTYNDWNEGQEFRFLAWMPLPQPYKGE